MPHTARIATKLVLRKQTCFSLKELVWAFSIYHAGLWFRLRQPNDPVLELCPWQEGTSQYIFWASARRGEACCKSEGSTCPLDTSGAHRSLQYREPEMELACVSVESQLAVGASLARVRADIKKSKCAATSPSSSSTAFPSGYKLPGAAKAKCFQHCTSSPALCMKNEIRPKHLLPPCFSLSPLIHYLWRWTLPPPPSHLLSFCSGLR